VISLESFFGDSMAKMITRFEGSPLYWKAATVAWADIAGPLVADELRREAPVSTGRLRDSLRYQRQTDPLFVELQFHSNVPYAPYVVHGTAPHIIEPVAAQALHWHDKSGTEFFAAVVHHPGTKPNNFPQRALENTRTELIASYLEALRKAFSL